MASSFRAGESAAQTRMRRDAALRVDHEGDGRGRSPIRRRRIEFNHAMNLTAAGAAAGYRKR
jgi:hypothetical protein